MKLAIMQPYFLPYVGYFQLISAVDIFIVYDNIKFTKKGWINRNRMLQNSKDVTFSLPVKKASESLNVCEREISEDFNRKKMLNQFRGSYHSAPFFEQTFPLIESILFNEEKNLFHFLYSSIKKVCKPLEIGTRIVVSSELPIDHNLKGQDKVLAMCEHVGATTYINPIGGIELYSERVFKQRGFDLKFLKSKPLEYKQIGPEFVPWLSIVDVMMFNPLDTIQDYIKYGFELV